MVIVSISRLSDSRIPVGCCVNQQVVRLTYSKWLLRQSVGCQNHVLHVVVVSISRLSDLCIPGDCCVHKLVVRIVYSRWLLCQSAGCQTHVFQVVSVSIRRFSDSSILGVFLSINRLSDSHIPFGCCVNQ